MAFIMPASKYKSAAELPVPKDSRVQLVEVPEHKVGGWQGRAVDFTAETRREGCAEVGGVGGVSEHGLYIIMNVSWVWVLIDNAC